MGNLAIGQYGETLAANFLKRRGYEILARNVKTSFKEIDLITKINGVLVFVEVKTRTSRVLGRADEMMSQKKINNLKFAIALYLKNEALSHDKIRVDFIAVDIDRASKVAKIKQYKDIV